MNNSICNRYLLAFTMLLSIITSSTSFSGAPGNTAEDALKGLSKQELETLYQEYQKELEPYIRRALEQIHILDCMLQDLAFNLANNSTIATKDRRRVITTIRDMRILLSDLQDKDFVVIDEHLINSLILIIRTTISHLTTGLKRGIDSLEPIDPKSIQFPTRDEISFEELDTELTHNDALIKTLEKLSDNIGLHWYNKAYRTFKYVVIEPAKKIAPFALTGALLGTAAFFTWYYFGGEKGGTWGKWLRDKVGWPQDSDDSDQYIKTVENVNNHDQAVKAFLVKRFQDPDLIKELDEQIPQTVIPTKPTGLLGNFEQTLFRLKAARYALGYFFITKGLNVVDYLYPRLGRALAKKIKETDNFLMGGTYKNRAVDSLIDKSEVTFDNIIGQEDAKKYGRELCEYLKNPEFFDRTKVAPSTGILLFGNTRTGKSFYISALQGEIQKALGKDSFKVLKVSFEEVMKVGIYDIMEYARTLAPMIVVIEEIDLLRLQRIGDTKLLAEFMTAMSSCLQDNRPDKTVVIIGTTNKLENLEPALREDGRFGKHIYFDYPKFSERKQFIEQELTRTACNLKKFDIDKLARDTEGCSFEKLRLFIKRTFMRAKLYGETVSQTTLEQSIDENIRGISLGEVTLDNEQKQLVAAHLAGHAVASILLDPHQKTSKVTLRDVAHKIEEEYVGRQLIHKDEKQAALEHGKIFANHDHDMPGIESKDEKVKQCKIWLAGHVAETLLLGSCGYGYHPDDKQVALNIAKSITYGAIDLTTLPKKLRDQYYDAAFELTNTCEQEVTKLLEEHRKELAAVMNELIEKLTLDSQDLRRLVLGEQASMEQLDANSMLANLLKDQAGTEIEEQPALAEEAASVTA